MFAFPKDSWPLGYSITPIGAAIRNNSSIIPNESLLGCAADVPGIAILAEATP